MERAAIGEEFGSPDRLVGLLVSRLKRHRLWDCLLLSFPPFLASAFVGAFLYRAVWDAPVVWLIAGGGMLGSALLMGLSWLRRAAPSLRFAARLIDERAEARDRFVTLATINPSAHSPLLVSRLRHEAAGLMHRLDMERDFPYRVKRSFLESVIFSLSLILLFLLVLQVGPLWTAKGPGEDRLARLAQRLARAPRFAELARNIEALAPRLREPALSQAERSFLIHEILVQVETQRAKEQQLGGVGSDLLDQAANALRELEKKHEGGVGGTKDNSPDEARGGGKKSDQGGETRLRSEGAQTEGSRPVGREPGRGEREELAKKPGETDQGGAEKGGPERGRGPQGRGAGKDETGGKGSKNIGEEIPKGEPAERFLKSGEVGEKGIKGARFVTVELPEEGVESEAGQSGTGKRRQLRFKTPVGNVPLRQPDTPDAAPEKQPLPLEYRNLIR